MIARRTLSLGFAATATVLLLTLLVPAVHGQDPDNGDEGWSLRLMANDVGLGIGHVPRITGLRLNWSDRRLERVRGINVSVWRADEPVGGSVQGLAIGSIPRAGIVQGIGLGLGVVGENRLTGLHLGAIAAVSGGALDGFSVGGIAAIGGDRMDGLHFGGLAAVAGTRARGLQASGLATVSGDEMEGVQLGGLAAVAGTDLSGLQLGGLAVVAGDRVRGVQAGGLAVVGGSNPMLGLQLAGLGVVSGGGLRGIQAAGLAVVGGGPTLGIQLAGLATVAGSDGVGLKLGGLATVAGDRLDGIQIGGLGTVAGCQIRGIQASLGMVEVRRDVLDSGLPSREASTVSNCPRSEIVGLTAAGYRVRGGSLRGVTATLAWIDAQEVQGLSIAGYQRTGLQVGLAVGVVNWADELRGVQLGLLNRAGNNPSPFRILPILNLNFSD